MSARALITTLLLLASLGLPGLAHAATYYVSPSGADSAPGTEAQPFRTVTRGIAALAGGDTLYLRAGVYRENVNPVTGAFPNGRGSWDTATVLAGYPGEHAVLQPDSGASHSVILKFGEGGGFAWIIVKNLELDGGPGGINTGVNLGGDSHHIRMTDLHVHHTQSHLHGGGGGFHEFTNSTYEYNVHGYGTYWSGHHSLFAGVIFRHISGFGVHMYNTGADNVSDNIVCNSEIYNNGFTYSAGSLLLSHGTNNQAFNNLIYNNATGVVIDHSCLQCQLTYNTIYGNGTSGVVLAEVHPESTRGSVVRNNILWGNPSAFRNAGDPQAVYDHNYEGDPRFVDAPRNFHLQSGSPALTASTSGGEVGAYGQGGGPGTSGSACPAAGLPSPGPIATPPPPPRPPLPAPRNVRALPGP
jgi:hypothetical protein